MSYKINKKGKIHKDYHSLDLLLNEKYYKQFNPVIIKLKEPIIYPEHFHGETLIPEFTLDKFIVNAKKFEKILQKKLSFFSLENNNSTNIRKINLSNIEYDFHNNKKEDVFDILKDNGIPNFISLYSIQSEGFYNSIQYYDTQLLNVALGMLFMEQDENKRLSAEEFLHFFDAKRINTPTFEFLVRNDKSLLNTKNRLKEHFKSFLSEKMIELSINDLSFYTQTDSTKKTFSNGWLEEQNREKFTHFINILENPIVSSSFSEKEKNDLIIKIIKENNGNRSNFHIDTQTIVFFSKKKEAELKDFFKDLNNNESNTNQMKIGDELKKILSQCDTNRKDKHPDIDSEHFFIKYIPWQEISLNKFPEINSKVDTPYTFYDNLKLRYHQVGNIYNKNEAPVLYNIMSFLDSAYKRTISLLHNHDDLFEDIEQEFDEYNRLINASFNIYLTNKGIFVKFPKPKNETGVNIPELMNFIVDSISIDNFANGEKFNSELTQKILEQKMRLSFNNNDDSAVQHETNFKI